MTPTSPARHIRRLLVIWLALAFLVSPGLLWGAELRLREALLQAQRDRVTATITAVVNHIGREAHPLAEDCDLHVPLRSREIRVPLIGEVKNACSEKPPGTPRSYWSDRVYDETHGLAVPATGVFRIWLEHPPWGNAIQTEAERVPWYQDSNPDHQVELHPLLSVGTVDFRSHVKWIQQGTQRFEGYRADRLPTVLNKRVTIQRVTVGGEAYIRIRGTKTGFNHWNLRGRVIQAPQPLVDGVALRLDILDGNQVIPDALNIPAVAVSGTVAHTKAAALGSGDLITFQALIRMHLPTILAEVDLSPKEIRLPIEFVLLDLE